MSGRTVRQVKHGERLRRSQNSLSPPLASPGVCLSRVNLNASVEVEGYGPYKPVPPPKPLQQPGCFTPPPYRMPPYPLQNESNTSIPGAAGLDSPSATSSPLSQNLQTHSNKFPIEREVILSTTDKNSKIPILHDYKKRTKPAIAPDVPPKQMSAWTLSQVALSQQQAHILSPDQAHPAQINNAGVHNGTDQNGLYRASYQDLYMAQSTGAVPRSSWQAADIIRPSPAPRQYQQAEDCNNQTITVQIENLPKELGKSKSVTKTYHTIKDLISNRFKSTKDVNEDQLNNAVPDENEIKTAGEQGIYGKPLQNVQYRPPQLQQVRQQQNFYAGHQLTQARSQEMLAQPTVLDQIYYPASYGSAPQRPQRYGIPQTPDYVYLHHQEKRSAQQIERDNLRQQSFEACRAASQPLLTCDTENNPQTHPVIGRRGSNATLLNEEVEKDSDDGGFLKKIPVADDSSSKVPDALVGSPRKRLEGEIGKIEGVYNIVEKGAKSKTDGVKKSTESGASSDYDKPGHGSSNVDSGRGSAAYSSGRVTSSNPSNDYKDLYHQTQDSEWVDVVENDLRTILEPKLHELSLHGKNTVGVSNSTLSDSISSVTPPLPPLSPGEQSSPNLSPRTTSKHKKHHSLPYGSKPEYGHDSYNKLSSKAHAANIGPSRWGVSSTQKQRVKKVDMFRGKQVFGLDTTDLTSTTTRSLDLESMLDNQSDSDGDISTTDARAIRKQLESLEGMYSEVLKLLGVKKYTGRYQPSDPRFSKRRYGSMSSLPSSSVSSRPIRSKRSAHEDRKKVKDIRGINKRFQRLESHVVTLARSVAHLSSEMRTQHLMIQEMETIRSEISALRTQTNMLNVRSQTATRVINSSKDLPNLTNPTRVRKLTKFFGDEPPLLRLFLRKLGYEKYANIFENEKIGMVELPYLSEERLQKMGVPLGPRLRILQEAQISVCKETTLCIV